MKKLFVFAVFLCAALSHAQGAWWGLNNFPMPVVGPVQGKSDGWVVTRSAPSHVGTGLTCLAIVNPATGVASITNTAGYTWTGGSNAGTGQLIIMGVYCAPFTNNAGADTITLTYTGSDPFNGGIVSFDVPGATSIDTAGYLNSTSANSYPTLVTLSTWSPSFSGDLVVYIAATNSVPGNIPPGFTVIGMPNSRSARVTVGYASGTSFPSAYRTGGSTVNVYAAAIH